MSRSLPVPTSTWSPMMIGAIDEKYCCVERRDLDVPDFLAGSRVELHEVVVVGLDEEEVPPHADAAMAGVRAAARLPVELPEDRAVARVDGPDVVGRRRVEDAVDHQDRSADLRGAAGVELAGAFAGDRQRIIATAAAARPRIRRRRRRRPPRRRRTRALDESASRPTRARGS